MVAVSRKGSAEWTLPAAACPRGRIEGSLPLPLLWCFLQFWDFFFFFCSALPLLACEVNVVRAACAAAALQVGKEGERKRAGSAPPLLGASPEPSAPRFSPRRGTQPLPRWAAR